MQVRERAAETTGTHVERHRWAVLAAAVLGTALAYMSDDMLNLAIPSVARDLQAGPTAVQWILNAYYVPLVAFVLVAGSLGDNYGHRRVFTGGLLLFSSGAVLCDTGVGRLSPQGQDPLGLACERARPPLCPATGGGVRSSSSR